MELKHELREFIATNFVMGRSRGPLDDDDSLLDNGIIDSTGVLELVTFLEERFGIAVADEEMVPENLDSIANLTAFVLRKLEQREN